jgi:acetylornithine deacetylase/succinyl-diaminopimelate desuccinylase-like protein
VAKRHGEAVERLRRWIALPTIAAEGLNTEEGVRMMMELLREAGFQKVERVPTDGKPGVLATLDAGAPRTVGLYFVYDVKQFDPKEWSSPPLEARLVDRPGLGKVMVGRGAVNQKGPQAAFLAALHAFRGAGRRLPVNLVLVAEGEEEIASPHFAQVVRRPDVAAALARTVGVFMPSAVQGLDGEVAVSLGAKGVVELELVASAERWGRGAGKDVHSANRARLDSPAFHLVQALATLVTAGGDPAIDGFADAARPLSPEEARMIDDAAARRSEAATASTRSSGRATPAPTRAGSSPGLRSGSRRATSASATGAAPKRPTSTTSSRARTRRCAASTTRPAPSSTTSTS